MKNKIKVAVLGATGFTGEMLVEILLDHPKVEVTYLASRTPNAIPYHKIFPRFYKKTDLLCENLNLDKAAKNSDIIFLTLPHTVSMSVVPQLLKEKRKIIDLSADYRIKNLKDYKKYYKIPHKDKINLKKAVYGLPEINKDLIPNTDIIANPGCYPTSVILALFPLLKEGLIEDKVIVDAKSSITGAGRKAVIDYHYSNISDNIWAYKPFIHQHTPEILSILKENTARDIDLTFVPHVVGVDAGIYSTIYITFKNKISKIEVTKIYNKYYKNCTFIRLLESLPKLKNVIGTNFCDIGFALNSNGKDCVLASSIDNLIKGAAGAAIQNMNIMQGWPESLGLL
ncbi:MAG: N-acetyl-gamma-glutamyl-phosphate reductase [Candidatus Omnitrophica bacterium]|nr:N-acetyl-gamma-glutamyl-phosphate reductase [Candidatus Omnitrophota bacterium]